MLITSFVSCNRTSARHTISGSMSSKKLNGVVFHPFSFVTLTLAAQFFQKIFSANFSLLKCLQTLSASLASPWSTVSRLSLPPRSYNAAALSSVSILIASYTSHSKKERFPLAESTSSLTMRVCCGRLFLSICSIHSLCIFRRYIYSPVKSFMIFEFATSSTFASFSCT